MRSSSAASGASAGTGTLRAHRHPVRHPDVRRRFAATSCSSSPRSSCSTSASRVWASSTRRSVSAACSARSRRSPRRPAATGLRLRVRPAPLGDPDRADRHLPAAAVRAVSCSRSWASGTPSSTCRADAPAAHRAGRGADARVRGDPERLLGTVGLGAIFAPLMINAVGIRWALIVTGALLPLSAGLPGVGSRRSTPTRRPDAGDRAARTMPLFEPLPATTIDELALNLDPRPRGRGNRDRPPGRPR